MMPTLSWAKATPCVARGRDISKPVAKSLVSVPSIFKRPRNRSGNEHKGDNDTALDARDGPAHKLVEDKAQSQHLAIVPRPSQGMVRHQTAVPRHVGFCRFARFGLSRLAVTRG